MIYRRFFPLTLSLEQKTMRKKEKEIAEEHKLYVDIGDDDKEEVRAHCIKKMKRGGDKTGDLFPSPIYVTFENARNC